MFFKNISQDGTVIREAFEVHEINEPRSSQEAYEVISGREGLHIYILLEKWLCIELLIQLALDSPDWNASSFVDYANEFGANWEIFYIEI